MTSSKIVLWTTNHNALQWQFHYGTPSVQKKKKKQYVSWYLLIWCRFVFIVLLSIHSDPFHRIHKLHVILSFTFCANRLNFSHYISISFIVVDEFVDKQNFCEEIHEFFQFGASFHNNYKYYCHELRPRRDDKRITTTTMKIIWNWVLKSKS